MKAQNWIEPVETRSGWLWNVGSSNRVVLYSESRGAGLLRCGREARQRGDRVVSAACEGRDRRRGRQALYSLVDRLLDGEFDAIVAVVG